MIRALAVVPYPVGRVPGQRYRIEQWAILMEREGVEVVFSPFLSPVGMDVLYSSGRLWTKASETLRGYVRRLAESVRRGSYDVAYVFREAALLGPPWLEAWLSRSLPIVYDFDDAIYLPAASRANAWVVSLKSPGKTAAICRRARHVTVGNETLASFARPLSRAVTVIPSTIDTDAYRVRERPANPRPIVGWTGSVTTAAHLEGLAPALARLRKGIDYELRVIGGKANVPGTDLRFVPWRAETEAEDLTGVDVGLMPLPDDEWSRGKCGMKALQYMALGIPPVVSAVGANATIVQHGVNGLHARSEDDWVDGILSLLRDPALRARLGAAARRTVEEGYSARVQAPRMAQVLKDAAGS
jgi:glycosyltransferase involved in cell wall biosynthesis